MSRFTTCVSCACGARYERAEARLPIKDVGIYECHHCGQVLERWQGRVVPEFKFLDLPVRKTTATG